MTGILKAGRVVGMQDIEQEQEQGQEERKEPISLEKILLAQSAIRGEMLQVLPLSEFLQQWDDPESDFTSEPVSQGGVPGSGGSGPFLLEHFAHVGVHEHVQEYCQSLVNSWRYRVEPMWSIEVCVKCPYEMEKHEASVWWDEEHWYACIEVSCAHLEGMLEWLVVHEVAELRRWRTTTHFFEVLGLLVDGADKERLVRQFHVARNQEVEMEVYDLLGHRRPFHGREEV